MDLLFIFKNIIMAIVEGITEFLPVSSTGHLIITQSVLGLPADEFNNMYSVVIQLAAILAVLILFWSRIWTKLSSFFRGEKEGRHFMFVWVLGCIPAVVLGLAYELLDLDTILFTVPVVAAALLVGAIFMIVLERRYEARTQLQPVTETMDDMTWKQALIVGFAQCASLWPGFSRSASTIMGGWLAGFSTPLAADYSFFLAIPVMFGASGLKLVRFSFAGISSEQVWSLILGFIVAFVVALLVVKAFIAFLHRRKLRVFAWYRIALAVLLIVLMLSGVLGQVSP